MNKVGTVPVQNLTAKFFWDGKECLIGKFDLENPDVLINAPWDKLGTELLFQIAASGVFDENELLSIAMAPPDVFLNSIVEL